MNYRKIFSSIFLLLLVSFFFWMFIHYFPLDPKTISYKKIILSSFPAYIMMYISLLVHMFNFIENSTLDVSAQIGSIDSNKKLSLLIDIANNTKRPVILIRIESIAFKTKYFAKNEFIIKEKSHCNIETDIAIRNNNISSWSKLENEDYLYINLYIRYFGSKKARKHIKIIKNPYKV